MRAVSIATMIEQLSGLVGTVDITDWQEGFVKSIVKCIGEKKDTRCLSTKQIETIDRIWRKHFS